MWLHHMATTYKLESWLTIDDRLTALFERATLTLRPLVHENTKHALGVT